MTFGDEVLSTTIAIVNGFANYFHRVYTQDLPSQSIYTDFNNSSCTDILEFSEECILESLLKLPNKLTAGEDILDWANAEESTEDQAELRHKFLSKDSKQICLNVYHTLKKDAEFKSKSTALQKAALLEGVPYSTMCYIARLGIREKKTRKDYGKMKEVSASTTKLLRHIIYDKNIKTMKFPSLKLFRELYLEWENHVQDQLYAES
nr:unnamed protein product [Callosobruchus chinensis]